jgi:hypothetical protein
MSWVFFWKIILIFFHSIAPGLNFLIVTPWKNNFQLTNFHEIKVRLLKNANLLCKLIIQDKLFFD